MADKVTSESINQLTEEILKSLQTKENILTELEENNAKMTCLLQELKTSMNHQYIIFGKLKQNSTVRMLLESKLEANDKYMSITQRILEIKMNMWDMSQDEMDLAGKNPETEEKGINTSIDVVDATTQTESNYCCRSTASQAGDDHTVEEESKLGLQVYAAEDSKEEVAVSLQTPGAACCMKRKSSWDATVAEVPSIKKFA